MQERVIDRRQLIKRLARERESRGLTQAEVARKMRTSQPYIARLESADNDPRLSTLLRYAAIVGGALALAAILSDLSKGGGGTRR